MIRFELKKVFVKPSSRIALLLLALLLGVSCFLAIDGGYVINEQGERDTGIRARRMVRDMQKEWEGELTEEVLANVIAENARINALPGYWGEDGWATNIGYSWKQGISHICEMLCRAFGGFLEYDFRRVDSLFPADAGQFYERRILQLKEWLSGEAIDQFSDGEKEFLVRRYEELKTPLYYDYVDGWNRLFEYAPTVIMITVMTLGFLAAGIFSGEFQLKADAIFFSSLHGRGRASGAKLWAGLIMVTAIYWVMMLIYSAAVLVCVGADGAGCAIQLTGRGWKSFYNITIGQEYLLILFGGYFGALFMMLLVMLASAKARSAVLAVTIPFFLIFLPNLLAMVPDPLINKVCGLLPDQLLQMNMTVCYFNLYQIGGKVMGAVPILFVVYLALAALLGPVIYQVFRKAEAG